MAEYALGTYRLTGQFPEQVVLYVGEAPLAMPGELRGRVLTRLRDHKEAIRVSCPPAGTGGKGRGSEHAGHHRSHGNDIIGPAIRQGLEKGREEGR